MSGSDEVPCERIKYIYVSRLCHLLIFIAGICGMLSYILIIYLSVIAHECAHLFMCKRLNVKTEKISFYPYGAKLTVPSLVSPEKQILISLSGPLCSLLLFITGKLLFMVYGNHYISYFSMINLSLFLFNMLPSIPLDGGEILRSFLGFCNGIINSFRITVYISYFFELVFLILGFVLLINSHNFTLIIISAIILKNILTIRNNVIFSTGKILTQGIKSDKKIKLIVKHKDESLYTVIKNISFGYTLIIAVYDGERYIGFVSQRDVINNINFVQTFGECVEKI